jgi:voltage-gated potassium channel Kch
MIYIGICVLLLVLTTAVHAGAMVFAFDGMKLTHARHWGRRSILTRLTLVSFLVVTMFLAALIETGLWALTYLAVGALSSFGEALYFSMVTFTTLGYGDITLDEKWRLLSSFAAANGTIMFGWTTALIMTLVHRLYTHEKND